MTGLMHVSRYFSYQILRGLLYLHSAPAQHMSWDLAVRSARWGDSVQERALSRLEVQVGWTKSSTCASWVLRPSALMSQGFSAFRIEDGEHGTYTLLRIEQEADKGDTGSTASGPCFPPTDCGSTLVTFSINIITTTATTTLFMKHKTLRNVSNPHRHLHRDLHLHPCFLPLSEGANVVHRDLKPANILALLACLHG